MNWGGPEWEGTGWDWRSAVAFAITAALLVWVFMAVTGG
jgi:hypothetical protein